MADKLHLVTIWAKFEEEPDRYGPQFVAAFPVSFMEMMPDSYVEWARAACELYAEEVDDRIVAFFEGRASIERPGDFEQLTHAEEFDLPEGFYGD